MHFISLKAGLVAALVAIVFCFHKTAVPGKDELKDLPQLGLPLTDKKLVIAHCMTNIIRYKGHKLEDSCNPEYYSPANPATSSLGGLTQVNVMSDPWLAEASLDEAVEFEMRTAIASGIDGFQFYYTLGNDSWDEIIKAYLRVASQKSIDFKFTFCISHPSGGDESGRIASFARRINSILDEAGRNNPHWLRTPDGRLILYTWYGDGLADVPETENSLPSPYYVANAYRKLGDAVKEKFACVISINEQISKEKLNHYLDYFPAVWLWTLPYTDNFIGNMVARECKKRNRVFTGSAFPDFYTSKLLKRGTWDMYHFVADAVKAGIKNTERKYIATGLSYNFRKQLEFGFGNDVPIMNIITWNDYPEGHHLAPEVNHNDGFSILLKYYKSRWKKEPSPYAGKDVLIAFYKKYNHSLSPYPFHIPVVEIEKSGMPISSEDSVEVVSILDKQAVLSFNKLYKEAGAGLQSTRFPATPGPVNIFLKRDNAMQATLECPEWITGEPYRTDRLTYTFSNESDSFFRSVSGGRIVLHSTEYDKTSPANKISYYGRPATP